jgi:purine-binding chemotaxis protein CheW
MSFEAPPSREGSQVEGTEPLLAFADALLASTPHDPGRAKGEVQQYVTFFLRDDEIGIPILQCREIVRVGAITRVPEAPDHVRGVVNLRGRVLPAVDTRKCLGYESVPPTARSRLLVVEVAGRAFALLVDRISRILKLATADIAALPDEARVRSALGVARDGNSTITITDAERILRPGFASEVTTSRSEEA